jgi:hypothetical protein
MSSNMIHFDSLLKLWQFDLPHHNVNNGNYKLIYNQLFLHDKLHLLNIKSGTIYTNSIDLDKVDILKQYNFNLDSSGRFKTRTDSANTYIHQLVFGAKTNENYVINHLDSNASNNIRSNLELLTQWFNTTIKKKFSGLFIGLQYTNYVGSYVTQIRMPKVNGKSISFGSKNLNYLQNIHYQFATKSGLVSPRKILTRST